MIDGAVAWLDCAIREVIPAGDHSILLGLTEACGWQDVAPLLFHRGVMTSIMG